LIFFIIFCYLYQVLNVSKFKQFGFTEMYWFLAWVQELTVSRIKPWHPHFHFPSISFILKLSPSCKLPGIWEGWTGLIPSLQCKLPLRKGPAGLCRKDHLPGSNEASPDQSWDKEQQHHQWPQPVTTYELWDTPVTGTETTPLPPVLPLLLNAKRNVCTGKMRGGVRLFPQAAHTTSIKSLFSNFNLYSSFYLARPGSKIPLTIVCRLIVFCASFKCSCIDPNHFLRILSTFYIYPLHPSPYILNKEVCMTLIWMNGLLAHWSLQKHS
jgi:hypothetical protein